MIFSESYFCMWMCIESNRDEKRDKKRVEGLFLFPSSNCVLPGASGSGDGFLRLSFVVQLLDES